MDPHLPSLAALNGRITPSLSSFILSRRLREVMLATQTVRGLALGSLVNPMALFGDTSAHRPPLPIASAPGWSSRSRRMPCELLDAPDDLRKQTLSQLA
jgi:hypothetical protein